MNEVKAAKHLGQHFLRDEAVIARLLAVINAQAGEHILEIGPGLGALTLPLLRQIGELTAVEYDPRVLAPLAEKTAPLGTLHLIHADILDIHFDDIPPPPVGEGGGGYSKYLAPATKSLPPPQDAVASAAGLEQLARSARKGWGGGKASASSTVASLSTITGEAFTASHSLAEIPPPPVGEGRGGGNKQSASATSTPSSPRGGEVSPHTAAAEPGNEHAAPATKKLRLVGNLPYNLSSPILFHCLAQRQHIHDMHYMLQKEVVDRITAAPGSKTYGRLSLMAQLWCETTALFDIPPDAFDPPPKVDSAVVRLVPRTAPAWQIDDLATFDETVRLAFAQRRKMLRKTFAHWLSADTLAALAIDPTARAETLDGAAFARLANARYQQERQK
ncbi:MAG: ribosomal RNA small subunit methyltransferase A [Cardiobacterium sp.]